MTLPFGFREFVRPRIPVVSDPNASRDLALPPPGPVSDVGLDWGKESFLNFTLSLGPQPPYRYPPNVRMGHTEDQLIERHGHGVEFAEELDGSEASEGPVIFGGSLAEIFDMFFIKTFIETTYETKTFGNVTSVFPVETHVKLYLQWTDVTTFGLNLIDNFIEIG